MICPHGIHMDNACGACEPPRGSTVRGWDSCVMGPAAPAIEARCVREGAEAPRGANNPYREGSAAATWWARGNAGVGVGCYQTFCAHTPIPSPMDYEGEG